MAGNALKPQWREEVAACEDAIHHGKKPGRTVLSCGTMRHKGWCGLAAEHGRGLKGLSKLVQSPYGRQDTKGTNTAQMTRFGGSGPLDQPAKDIPQLAFVQAPRLTRGRIYTHQRTPLSGRETPVLQREHISAFALESWECVVSGESLEFIEQWPACRGIGNFVAPSGQRAPQTAVEGSRASVVEISQAEQKPHSFAFGRLCALCAHSVSNKRRPRSLRALRQYSACFRKHVS